MKRFFLPLALAATAISTAPAVAAQDTKGDSAKVEREMAIFEKLMSVFDTGNSEPIDEQQLTLARITAGKILPDGTYGRLMEKTFDQMLMPLVGLMGQMDAAKISAATGVEESALYDLDEEALSRVGKLLDPNVEERGSKMLGLMVPKMKEAFIEIEPALREGMARAYARKFSGKQLKELNSFFETPTGSLYAAESFVLMADPEIMNASMQAMPSVMEKVLTGIPAMEEEMKDVPEPRTLADLSDGELSELAALLSVDVGELKEFRDAPPLNEASEE